MTPDFGCVGFEERWSASTRASGGTRWHVAVCAGKGKRVFGVAYGTQRETIKAETALLPMPAP